MEDFLKKEGIVVFAILVLIAGYFIFKAKPSVSLSGESQIPAPSASFSGQSQAPSSPGLYDNCSVTVDQPACQKKDSPTLTLRWENCAKQKRIFIQIDDTVKNGTDFPHPEYDSGEVENNQSEYTFSPTKLKPGTTYHPSVAFITEKEGVFGWRDTGFHPFIFNDFCK